MSQRTLRLNQLLHRAFSEHLHTRWRDDAAAITITGVEISPDLHNATLYYSAIGDAAARERAQRFLTRVLNPLKSEVFKQVQIKYTPHLHIAYDESPARGTHLIDILDSVAREDAGRTAKSEN
ncbi:MAG: ribosome-binding factor A [Puniceicoccales bacterium]|jgi:ribosome-binding factor A|nr:ribosome-binding factor A [Puniceicoccales bacterium]